MKFSLNTLIAGIMFILVGINIAIFIKGIRLSNEISYYEGEIARLNEQNIEYEQHIYKIESHVSTASLAAELEYGKYNEPIYLQKPRYALNK